MKKNIQKTGCGCTGRVMSEDELDAIYNGCGNLYLSCFSKGRIDPELLKKGDGLKLAVEILGKVESLMCEINRLKKKCKEK